jgi:hypothetical protein
MPYRASQDVSYVGLGGELTAAEELRVQELQALSDTAADEALGKLSGSVVKKEVTGGDNYTLPTATDSILGGVKVGSGLSITEGVLAVTGGSMVYPGAGIPLSTGEAWGDSITNNSANWNTAYGWGNHASAGYVTGTPWTAEGYLTALTGAVLTDQTTPQTIGLIGARLAMLWATDITCTNAIAGSVTGNAGTVTNGVTATSVITDNAIVRGNGGARGVQGSAVTIDDNGKMWFNNLAGIIEETTLGFRLGYASNVGATFELYKNDHATKPGQFALVYGNTGVDYINYDGSDWALKMRLDRYGRLGIGTNVPTAILHLKAGTATAGTAPLKLTAGVVNTTAEAGAIEFDGTDLFITI